MDFITSQYRSQIMVIKDVVDANYNPEDIKKVQGQLVRLTSISSNVADVLGWSKKVLLDAKEEARRKVVKAGLTAKEVEIVIDSKVSDQEAFYLFCKTLEQHVRSHIDSVRTIISLRKTEIENNLKSTI